MNITVNGQLLTVADDTLVSNSVGIYECEFTFDASWDGFDKTSVWKLNSDDPIEVVISNGKATIPHEVLVNAGFLRIGVYGTKDEKVMPTVWGEKRKVHLGTPTGSIGTEPTPSIYAQILAVAENAVEVAEGVQTEWANVSAEAESLAEGESATASYSDGVFTFGIPVGATGAQGIQGEKGDTGNGIASVTKVKTGLYWTYTFHFTDGTTYSFNVNDGVGIASITLNSDYTLTIDLTDGSYYTTSSIRGEKGERGERGLQGEQGIQGETGNGIASVVKTATVGLVDTYTITFTDGTTTTFEVTNGAEGRSDFASYLPIDSASGTIASFTDGAEDIAVESCVVALEPIQDLNGQSSPYPAGGGKNLLDESIIELGSYNNVGNTTVDGDNKYRRLSIDLPAGTYTFSTDLANCYIIRTLIDNVEKVTQLTTQSYTFTLEQASNFKIACRNTSSTAITTSFHTQIEIGSIATTYAPYSNICPISGHDSVVVRQTGKNLYPYDKIATYSYGWYSGSTALVDAVYPIKLIGGYTYALSYTNANTDAKPLMRVWRADGTILENEPSVLNAHMYGSASTFVFQSTPKYYNAPSANNSNCAIISPTEDIWIDMRMQSGKGESTEVILAFGNSLQTYEPYNGNTYTSPLPQTVYGGTLDLVSGVLTIDRVIKTLDGVTQYHRITNRWTERNSADASVFYFTNSGGVRMGSICDKLAYSGVSYTDMLPYTHAGGSGTSGTYSIALPYTIASTVEEANEWLAENTPTICYKLATPQTITLTPQEIATFKSANNIWSDNGTISVTYRADIQGYIDKKISALATL